MKGWLILTGILFASCSQPQESAEAFYRKRGMQYIKIGDTELTARIVKAGSAGADTAFVYFNVTINRLKDEPLNKEKSMYVDFDMQNDFVASVGADSLAPAICQRIMNGKSGSYEYMLAFERKPAMAHAGVTLVYNDKIFGVGKLAFAYPGDAPKPVAPKS